MIEWIAEDKRRKGKIIEKWVDYVKCSMSSKEFTEKNTQDRELLTVTFLLIEGKC